MVNWTNDSIHILIGYIISWGYVLVFLSCFQRMFGKSIGPVILYGSSFIVWYAVLYGLKLRIIT
jgi:hypothetical protein